MSITDELRDWAGQHKGWHLFDMQLNDIADRIDAEHEAACAEAYGNGVQSVALPDMTAYAKLPVDADGVPIRIGDVLDETTVMTYAFLPANVVGYHKCCGKVMPIVEHDGEFQVDPEFVCHYTKPTVEDVLREFASECLTYATCVDDHEVADAIELYAAKLQLRGDEE